MDINHYSPFHDIITSEKDKSGNVLLLLNNGPSLKELKQLLLSTWNRFAVVVCADGGTNSLYDSLTEEERAEYIPGVIIGDLDSAREQVLTYYKSKGSLIIHETDQDSTDFGKALNYISINYSQCRLVYVLNRMWGRFDQVLGNVHELYKTDKQQVYLVTEDSLLMLLKPGNHSIVLKREQVEGHCGLLPLGEPCTECWSTGLQWNLEGNQMMIGGLVSTCNLLAPKPHPQDYTVTIKCSHNLIFTVSHKLCIN